MLHFLISKFAVATGLRYYDSLKLWPACLFQYSDWLRVTNRIWMPETVTSSPPFGI